MSNDLPPEEKARRRAEALRANLKRRKQASRKAAAAPPIDPKQG